MWAALLEQPLLFAFLAILLEVPRYTGSIVVLLITSFRKQPKAPEGSETVTVIVPAFNERENIEQGLEQLLKGHGRVIEVILIDDGSTDGTGQRMQALAARDPRIRVFRHPERAGKSAAINHAARFAKGDLLLTLDADTEVHWHTVALMAAAFDDPKVAGATGNLRVTNAQANPITGLQSLEYLMSISLGRAFLEHLHALACLSGALSMFRRSAFLAVGGLNVGPGEDLEITLRLRHAGYRIHFVSEAIAHTYVPEGVRDLVRQRMRWDRDAFAIRVLMYRETGLGHRGEGLSDAITRLDFNVLEWIPTFLFPFYLAGLLLSYGWAGFSTLMVGIYGALLVLYVANIMMAFVALKRWPNLYDLILFPVLPLYQGVVMKLVRFVAFSYELLCAGSRRDAYIPERIRRALYGPKGVTQ